MVININVGRDKLINRRLEELISINKQKLLVESKISWEDNHWLLNNKNKIKFTKLSNNARHNEIMSNDFIDFAKLYIASECVYESVSKINVCIFALRILEYTLQNLLLEGVSTIDLNVLDESIRFISNKYSKDRAYKGGREIEKIILFLVKHNLTFKNIHLWKNPLKPDMEYFLYDGRYKHSKKMPSELALNIFAEIFSQPLEHKRDILTTSVVALLMSAPSRISEILSLPFDCYITEKTKNGEIKNGLRFWAGKGYGGDIKWIVSIMSSITKKAIERILSLTERPRAFAKLMELDFIEFHKRTKFSSFSEEHLLSKDQVAELLSNKKYTRDDSDKLLRSLTLKRKDFSYTIKTLWEELQSRLPENFPWYDKSKNLKYSDLLFLFFRNTFHSSHSESLIQLYHPDYKFFYQDIHYKKSMVNIFQRHGYTNENGDNIYFTSHQIRHLLNTLAQRKGLTEEEIAKWSGRANPLQNRVYNHISDEEILEQFESLQSETENYSISNQLTISDPLTEESYLSIGHSAVHTTEFGYCVHDYTISPCEKFRDCINCSEQICIKGCFDSLDRLKTRLLDTEQLIEKVTSEADNQDQDLGKDRWLTFHLKTKERLQELIGILENKDIPDNSFIRLTNKSYSHLSRTISTINLLENKKGEADGKKNN
ncbi:TPA: hypothetical protein MCA86_000185 [Klebsiella pneumoniae]|uniref:hypothetical protein n=2 Tax=Klebsiella pneumoniae TaxID=573 RepID=UPI000B71724D|nr:hypothetical protein [Klebsiella pneumoniae]HDS2296685.1 hypothetical protein [Klebsiella pneumoniae subsp. pneumoniae]EIX9420426.1 hypothetical protein [Klebsiella pneumoniae]EKW9572026.1 hypothetical protein [Klebsiella pneumoniae]MBC4887986.1 hypothetical protein [Klebsiella pneumoniae]MBG2291186.1 hypothetical protein [Klebsiella pneumoniae]